MRTLFQSVSSDYNPMHCVVKCLASHLARRLGEGTLAIFSLAHMTAFVLVVAEWGGGGQDGISCVEPFQKQAGCSHFGRSGQDPYKTRLQGAVLGSSVWDNCLPRGRHCRTSKFTRMWKCVVCNSSSASSLLLVCACCNPLSPLTLPSYLFHHL